jgi:RNA polymerase sigma-70 factor (ECF subfamily)
VNNTNRYIDTLLIEECKSGSRKAQFKLYKQYSRAMYNLAYRFMNNREDAEDILQETFTECFRNIKSFRSESTFGLWLRTILINNCINYIRKRKIDLLYYENVPEIPEEEENAVIYDTTVIFRNIEKLPDGYRIILTLYLLEGYDHTEIAQILQISESTSKSQYSRAKIKLKEMILNDRKNG